MNLAHTYGANCASCEGFCLHARPGDDAMSALRELVAVKQLREEVSRRKQRRLCSIHRDPDEVRAVAKLHQECKVREYRAWNVARAVITKSTGAAT